MRFSAAPNFERRGVIAGFVLSTGQELRPAISRGVLFAQGAMYRPAVAPQLPEAPASAQSWLHYHTGSGFYWTSTPAANQSDDASLGWVVTDATAVIGCSVQILGTGETAQIVQAAPVTPIASKEAPNQTPVTSGDNRCRVVLVAMGNRTKYQFAGAVTFHTSDPTYSNLKNVEIFADHSVGAANDRVLGYLTPPEAGQGDVTELWYTDLWDLPVGSDDTWALEFIALNAEGTATADPPRVEGLVVPCDTTSVPVTVTPIPIPPVTEFAVYDWGMDATQENKLFSCQWRMPVDMSNVSAVKIRVATPGMPEGQDVTGHMPFYPFSAGSGPFGELVRIDRDDLPSSAENWTWKCVTINAAGDGDNSLTAPTAVLSVGPAAGGVPDLVPPLPPTSISCQDTGQRVMVGANETFTILRATIVLPANHRASKIWLWFSDNGGASWGVVTNAWAAALSTFDFIERVPAVAASNWLVKATTASDQCTNPESTAVVSAPFSVGTLASPGANLITDGAVGSYTYQSDADGHQSWGLSYVQWTNPTPAACPEFFHSQLTVQKTDAAGNPAPDYEGIERIVDEDVNPGALRSKPIALWTLPSDATYKYFRLRLYILNRNLNKVLQNAWSGASYVVVSPTDPGGALQANRLAASTLSGGLVVGTEVSGGATYLMPAQTNNSNVLGNGDFQVTSAGWATGWTAVNAATLQTAGMETGQYLIRLGYHASGSAIVSAKIRVSKGQRYSASVRVKADSSPGGSLQVTFRFYNPSGGWLSASDATYTKSNVGTSWETVGFSADVPTGVDAYWVELRLLATPTSGKYYYIDRAEITYVTVQTEAYSASETTAVTLGEHLNPSSQFAGVSAKRSMSGWTTELRDDHLEMRGPSGRVLAFLAAGDSSTDFGQLNLCSDTALAMPSIVLNASGPTIYIFRDPSHSIQLFFLPDGTAKLFMNGVEKLSQAP